MPLYCTMVNGCERIGSYPIRSYRQQTWGRTGVWYGTLVRQGRTCWPHRRRLELVTEKSVTPGTAAPLSERARADERRALVILQRAGDDFRGRRGAAIDQDDDRLALGQIARVGVERVSSALRPRMETISPLSRNASETEIA